MSPSTLPWVSRSSASFKKKSTAFPSGSVWATDGGPSTNKYSNNFLTLIVSATWQRSPQVSGALPSRPSSRLKSLTKGRTTSMGADQWPSSWRSRPENSDRTKRRMVSNASSVRFLERSRIVTARPLLVPLYRLVTCGTSPPQWSVSVLAFNSLPSALCPRCRVLSGVRSRRSPAVRPLVLSVSVLFARLVARWAC
jgi:hypothetical protein